MIKTFFKYFLFYLFLEIVLHIGCFNSLSIVNLIMIFMFTMFYSIILTFIISCIKSDKLKKVLFISINIFFVILYGAELVYFKIYESFFSFNGLVFITALKDGYDKVLLTMFQNFIYILLFIGPVAIYLIKGGKKFEFINKKESLLLIGLFILSISYSSFMINTVNTTNNISMYSLMHNVNMPKLNVENFGLLESSIISVKRRLFGFSEKKYVTEDIYSNSSSVLNRKSSLKYNVTNIDFDNLINNELDDNIKSLHNYFSRQTPTVQNDYTGIFKNKNLIFIVAESFDEIAIDKDLTPTLYKLKHEGIIFNNYFAPKYPASTADGEYMLEWGILPIIGENYSLIDMVYNTGPYILPREFKNINYNTYVYHPYYGYYNYRKKYFSTLNFDGMRYCNDGINMYCDHFHGSDVDMIEQSVDDYLNKDHFFTYYITLSGHGSYDSSNFVAEKHIHKLDNYNYSNNIKYYMAANIDFDIAMEKLIDSLKKSGKLDDTVIVISSDHSPYYLTNEQVNTRSNIDRTNNFDRNRGSLIIYNSKLDKKTSVDKVAMNIDVLPTILNMFGIEYDSRLIIGKDIMASNNDGLVVFPDRSFLTNYGAYNANTNKFYKYVDNVDDKFIQEKIQEVNEKYQVSVNMQYSDYYKYIFK